LARPILAKNEVKNIEDALIKIDPVNKEYYPKNAINFTVTLDSLDALTRSTLQTCEKRISLHFMMRLVTLQIDMD
jgi:zinc transport system substrate-binding protein